MKILAAAVLAAGLALGGTVSAHDDDKTAAANGGQVRAAGEFHFELVLAKESREAKPNAAALYVTDRAGNKVSTAGAKGRLMLMSKRSGKQEILLAPDGGNGLRGNGTYASDADLVAVALVSLPGKKTEQARFTPLAAR